MKNFRIRSTLIIFSLAAVSAISAKECKPPTDGSRVTFTFEVDGETCSFSKQITKSVRANNFSYKTTGGYGGGDKASSYHSAYYGCDSNGNWAVDKSRELICKKDQKCSAQKDLTFSLKDSNQNNCKIKFGDIPALEQNKSVSNEYGSAVCLNTLVFKSKTTPFICPEEQAAGTNSSASTPGSDDPVQENSTNQSADVFQITNTANNNNNYKNPSKSKKPSKSKVDIIEEGFAANEQITAAAAAFGAGMGTKCEAGSRAKSFSTFNKEFKAYHNLVLSNVKAHTKGLEKVKKDAEELTSQAEDNTELLLQVASLKFQRDGIQLMIDLYNDEETGILPGKVNLLKEMASAQDQAVNEFKGMNDKIKRCDDQIAQALQIAQAGCSRIKIVTTCNDAGEECVDERIEDPVPGSCVALSMIPQATNLKEEFYNLQFQIMPSNILVNSQEIVSNNFKRYVSSSLPSGEWKQPLLSCGDALALSYQDYGVKCDTPQGALSNAEKWDAPIEGNIISDLYAGVLGRLPDKSGHHYWQSTYDAEIQAGKTPEQAAAEVRKHIVASNENQGIEDTEEEKESRKKYRIENNLEGFCEDVNCGMNVSVAASFEVDKWYSSIEDEARFKDLVKSEDDAIAIDDLKKISFDKFENGDLLVGSPYGRMELFPQMNDLISLSAIEDQGVVARLIQQRDQVIELIDSLEKLSKTSLASGGNGSTSIEIDKSAESVTGSVTGTTVIGDEQLSIPSTSKDLELSIADINGAISNDLKGKAKNALSEHDIPESVLSKSEPLLKQIKDSNNAAFSRNLSNQTKSGTLNNEDAKDSSSGKLKLAIGDSRDFENGLKNKSIIHGINPALGTSALSDTQEATSAAASSDPIASHGGYDSEESDSDVEYGGSGSSAIPSGLHKKSRSSRSRSSKRWRSPSSSYKSKRVRRKNSQKTPQFSSEYSASGARGEAARRSAGINNSDKNLFEIISKRYITSELFSLSNSD